MQCDDQNLNVESAHTHTYIYKKYKINFSFISSGKMSEILQELKITN
jgi:hypothetical protein